MDLNDILTLVITLASFFLSCLIPTVIVMIKKIKAYKAAKTEAEKQTAINEITELMKGFCADAESYFKAYEAEVKAKGGTCGPAKQDSVLTKVLKECITRNVDYDQEFWAKRVDDYVKSTKVVNAK